MDGGDRVGLEHLADQLVERRDHGELGVLQLGRDQLREPLADKLRPAGGAQRLITRLHAGFLGSRGVLAHRIAVHPKAAGDLGDRAARVPVDQDLGDVHHVEGPPCQPAPPTRWAAKERSSVRSGRVVDSVNSGLVNSLNAEALRLLLSVNADKWVARPDVGDARCDHHTVGGRQQEAGVGQRLAVDRLADP
jgi:hypothetical protein